MLCYRHFKQKLKKGTVGIFGPNGSGKTTLVDLIYGAITNDFGRFVFKKEELPNEHMGRKDSAYVRVIGEHNDRTFEIYRCIIPDKSAMTIDNDRTVTGAKGIEAELKAIGLDAGVLDTTVFKADATDFITATKANRAQIYKEIMPTENCGSIFNILNRYLLENRDKELVDNREELKATIQESKKQLVDVEKGIEATRKKLLPKEVRLQFQSVIEEWKLTQEREERRKKLHQEVTANITQLTNTKVNKAKSEEELKDKESRIEKNREIVERSRSQVTAYEALKQLHKQRNETKSRLDRAKASLKTLNETKWEKPDRADNWEAVEEEVRKYESEKALVENAIKHAKGHKSKNCVLCKQKLKDPEAFFGELQEQINVLQEPIKSLVSLRLKITNYRDRVAKNEREKENLERQIKEYETTLSKTGEPEPLISEEDKETAEKWIRANVKFTELVKQLKTDIANFDKDIAAVEREKKNKEEELEELTKQLQKRGTVAKNTYIDAKSKMKEHRVNREKLAELKGQHKAFTEEIVRCVNGLKAIKQRRKEMEEFNKTRKIVERVAGVFHWDALPKHTTQANLKLLENQINHGLRNFGMPFTIKVVDDFGFDVLFSDSKRLRPMASLSNGQKFILAVVFWPVVSSLDLLVMDEPTAFLDVSNRKYLRDALSNLTTTLRDRRQMIMVTHATELERSFDQVIHLE